MGWMQRIQGSLLRALFQIKGEKGQATVEYAALLTGFLVMVVALAALWRAGETGVLTGLIDNSGSHILSSDDPAGHIVDILLY